MKILLHICCGICSSAAIQTLQEEGMEVVGYFYNPNIYPREEYERRLAVARQVAATFGIALVEGEYDSDSWDTAVTGLEGEPEGGRRCSVCFALRLRATSRKAQEMGIMQIATTLSISPHKDAELINALGKEIDPAAYKEYNFKKKDGFKKTIDFAKAHQLYRQHYCGCRFGLP
ncbi:MAG TPA: epoxyqueuosine reductase QueH [Candidatus Omnitrophota bacterium]|nr:epoxyqueuosine reductase QueH [Candidatus Omnitrophota bacterium]HRZ14154.1 epoxyqueuosine reductase QueH [Candidatus Omnitrophota bacterium]